MPVVVIANPKGGVGKTTLATNVAGYFASQGHAVMLGDADRQQSSKLWLGLRPVAARPIATWDITADLIAKPPRGTTHVVLDTPGGLHGWRFNDIIKLADKIIVPLQPSVFDIFATRAFLDQLAEHRHAGKVQIGIVGMTPASLPPKPSPQTSELARPYWEAVAQGKVGAITSFRAYVAERKAYLKKSRW